MHACVYVPASQTLMLHAKRNQRGRQEHDLRVSLDRVLVCCFWEHFVFPSRYHYSVRTWVIVQDFK